LNANVAPVRTDERGIDELVRSIEDKGLVHPILIARDYLVVDGGRRLIALQRLDWDRIPVVVTDDWKTVVEYFKTGRNLVEDLGLPAEPLLFREFEEQVDNRLRAMYDRANRQQAARAGRKRKVSLDSAPGPRTRTQRNGFLDSVSEMLGITVSTLATMREVMTYLHRCEARDEELGKKANQLLDRFDSTPGSRLYSLHKLFYDMSRGEGEDGRYRVFPNQRQLVAAPVAGRPSQTPNLRQAREGAAVAERLLDQMESLADLANELGELNIAVEADVADELVRRYRVAQRKLGVLRTYLDVNSRRESSA
jgi:hypothetical protein